MVWDRCGCPRFYGQVRYSTLLSTKKHICPWRYFSMACANWHMLLWLVWCRTNRQAMSSGGTIWHPLELWSNTMHHIDTFILPDVCSDNQVYDVNSPNHMKILKIANNFLGSEIVFQFWTFIFVHFSKVNSSSLKKPWFLNSDHHGHNFFQRFSAYGHKSFQSQLLIWQGSATDCQRKAHFLKSLIISTTNHTAISANFGQPCRVLWSGAFGILFVNQKAHRMPPVIRVNCARHWRNLWWRW